MSWTAKHDGEVLLQTLTGQSNIDLGGGFGVVQVPIHPTAYGVAVPSDFVSNYKGTRVSLEFTISRTGLSSGWFAYAYLGSVAHDVSGSSCLMGNLNTSVVSWAYGAMGDIVGTMDFEFTATKFTPSPDTFAMWGGAGTYALSGLASGAMDASSLNHANLKTELASAFLQAYMGCSGSGVSATITAAYISEFPTADTPVPVVARTIPVVKTWTR